MPVQSRRDRLLGAAIGVFLVLALHGLALYGLWQYRLIPAPEQLTTLFVHFITPPTAELPVAQSVPPPTPPAKMPPLPVPVSLPPPAPLLVTQAPQPIPEPPLAPAPEPVQAAPAIAPATIALAQPASAQPAPKPAAPLTLGSELAVVCPQHTPPAYPAYSRRIGEQGRVVLRVELDEEGRVSEVRVQTGSGYPRLDDAALAALRNWRCSPAERDGRAVRSVALQPFNFVLEGR